RFQHRFKRPVTIERVERLTEDGEFKDVEFEYHEASQYLVIEDLSYPDEISSGRAEQLPSKVIEMCREKELTPQTIKIKLQ
ncbi:MAG: hypothetical protein R6V56_09115, partial [Lentisphaeria bacterium]